MATILITGSSGQIGTNLALHLSDTQHHVIGVDNRPNPWTDRFETYLSDLSRDEVKWPRSPAAAIVHLAANAKVHDSVVNPTIALKNYQMGGNALEYARARKIPIVLASSREVYGQQNRIPVCENASCGSRPVSPYGSSKLALESLASAYNSSYGIPAISLRFSNVFGRFDTDIARLERVIPLFLSRLIRRRSIDVFNASKTLDFTYIDDCIAGISLALRALLNNKVSTGEYNISSGMAFSLRHLIDHLEHLSGVSAKVNNRLSRTGEIDSYCANLAKSTKAFGYYPRYHLISGLNRAWTQNYAHVFSGRREYSAYHGNIRTSAVLS